MVRCSITGYGSNGPKAGKPGYDFILQAETGLMAITGEPDGTPMKLGVAIVDICSGMMAAIAILGALQSRTRTGRGQLCEVNLHDVGLQMLANVASNHLVSDAEPGRYGNSHPNIVPYRTYRAADGDLAVGVGNDGQFAAFAAALGRPDWSTDPRFARNEDRVRNRVEIDSQVAAIMGTRTAPGMDRVARWRRHTGRPDQSRLRSAGQFANDGPRHGRRNGSPGDRADSHDRPASSILGDAWCNKASSSTTRRRHRLGLVGTGSGIG